MNKNEFERDIYLEDMRSRQNEEMMREYNNRSFECSDINYDDSQYYDPYYGDLRYDPFGR